MPAAAQTTVKTQERVISKLERVLESRVLDRKRGSAASLGLRANEEHAGREREAQLVEQVRRLEDQLTRIRGHSAAPQPESGEREQLLVTLSSRDSQIKVLQEQMQQNARDSSREISQLKLKLMEHEMLL